MYRGRSRPVTSRDDEVVLDLGRAHRAPGGRAGNHAVARGVDGAGQLDLAALGRDGDGLGIKPGAMQRPVDVVADIDRIGARLDRRLIEDADHAHQPADAALGRFLLVMPVDLSGQRH